VLDEAGTDEEARALDLATARAGRLAGLPRERAYQRLSSLLMRRGYAPGIARGAAMQALDLQAEG
jgi:regulatory protein